MEPTGEGHRISRSAVIGIYGAMALITYAVGTLWLEQDLFVWADAPQRPFEVQLAAGAVLGLIVVGLSKWIDRFEWAHRLAVGMRRVLGEMDTLTIAIMAVCSGVAEEMLFRGLLQPQIGIVWSSLLFGMLHIGPNRTFIPWTIMAVGMGFVFGALFWFTGSLLAPILAHFTINFFNLHSLARIDPNESIGSAQ